MIKIRYKRVLICVLILLAFILLCITVKNSFASKKAKTEKTESSAVLSDSSAKTNTAEQSTSTEKTVAGTSNNTTIEASNTKSNLTFKKESTKTKPSFSTAAVKSSDNKYSVCVEGKGESGLEEGTGYIVVTNLSNNEMTKINLSANNLTPKTAAWYDDKNLLVVVGNPYGSSSFGGDLYLLNTDTLKSTLVYKNTKPLEQITSAKANGKNIDAKFIILNKDNGAKEKEETRTIKMQ